MQNLPSSTQRPIVGMNRFVSQPFRRETGDGGVVMTKDGVLYKLDSVLGVGGGSVVYVASRYSDKEVVALKLPNQASKENDEVLNFLRRESRVLSKLDHPSIVKLVDCGETISGDPFLAMELIRAQSLDLLMLANAGHVPLRRTTNIVAQLCESLAHCHERGVVHRDIKPQNVLVRTIDGVDTITLFDFGIATDIEDEIIDSGSLLYASPEQLENERCTAQSDVYQVALLFYEVLTGSLPFERTLIGAVRYRHGAGPLLPTNEELGARAIPEEIRQLLASALSPDPADRPATISVFAHDLRRAVTKIRMSGLRLSSEA